MDRLVTSPADNGLLVVYRRALAAILATLALIALAQVFLFAHRYQERSRAVRAEHMLLLIVDAMNSYRHRHGLPTQDGNITPALFGGPDNPYFHATPMVDGIPFYYHAGGQHNMPGEFDIYTNFQAATFDGRSLPDLKTFKYHTTPAVGTPYIILYDSCCGVTAWEVERN